MGTPWFLEVHIISEGKHTTPYENSETGLHTPVSAHTLYGGTLTRHNAKTATRAVWGVHRGLFFLTYGQKEGFSHQLRSESEAV